MERVADELHRLGSLMERQTRLGRRFVLGLVFGLGTALGASLIATLVILIVRLTLQWLGLGDTFGPSIGEVMFE